MLKKEETEVSSESDKETYKFIGPVCTELLNERILSEEHASRLYKSMAIWFKFKGYNGFHSFWCEWSEEELEHASWAREYLLDLNVLPETGVVIEVPNKFDNVKDIVEKTLEAEIAITKECNRLAKHAAEKGDHMLIGLAHRYMSEQQEEINKITNILSQLEVYGDDKLSIMALDKKLGKLL